MNTPMEGRWPMRYPDDAVSINWVSDDDSLASTVARWPDVIALDTEFLRTDTFYPKPGLYQIATPGHVDLIDPLAITAWGPFSAYLQNPATVKIMHACMEDLEVFHHHLGVVGENIFDTQLAQAFISPDYSLSYQGLVAAHLDIHLDKHETRSDWLARPLSEAQVAYAVEDVVYLLQLYDGLVAQLREHGRWEWFQADMHERARYALPDPQVYYQNVKKAWRLQPQQLATLQALCAWREETARATDIPRNRVVWDDHLMEFATQRELRINHVNNALPRRIAKRFAEQLLAVHTDAQQLPAPPSLPRPLNSQQGAMLKLLREAARGVAHELQFAPELLARKREVEQCLRHYLHHGELSTAFQAWRGGLVGDQFRAILEAGPQSV
ncbi:MAG: ribonuclease D [Pseudomonadota bacterium]